MLKKLIQVSCLAALIATLFGCTLSHQPPTCDQLKRQWIYYTTNPTAGDAINIDKLHQKMQEQNCL